MKITEFPMNQNLAPLYNKGSKVTIEFKCNYLFYGRKSIFHNVTSLGAYDDCIGNPGFMVSSEGINGQIFELSDIESIEIEKESNWYNKDSWVENDL